MFSHSKQTIPHFMDKLKIGLKQRSGFEGVNFGYDERVEKDIIKIEKSSSPGVPVSTTHSLYHQDDWT